MASKKRTTKTKAKARTAMRSTRRPKAAPKRAQQKGFTLQSIAPSFTVDDIEKSLSWYRDVIGFAVRDRWEDSGKLMGVELQDDWKKGRDRVKGEGFRLYCQTKQDVDQLASGIKSRGGSLAQEPRDEEWGSRAFTIVDPDGYKITISTPIKARR